MRVGFRHNEMRLLDALSWLSETWKISNTVRNAANSRCPVDVYTLHRHVHARMVIYVHISAWGFCVVCSFNGVGNSRASDSGTGSKYGTHAFSFHYINHFCRGEPYSRIPYFCTSNPHRSIAPSFYQTIYLNLLKISNLINLTQTSII